MQSCAVMQNKEDEVAHVPAHGCLVAYTSHHVSLLRSEYPVFKGGERDER